MDKQRKEKAQSEFLIQYMGHMLLDGDTIENRQRIQRFLALQDKNNNADYEIHFLNGRLKDVCLYADSLFDLDVADIYGIVGFTKMHVYSRNGLSWSTIMAEDFIQDIRQDVEFDGLTCQTEYEFKGALLKVDCDIE